MVHRLVQNIHGLVRLLVDWSKFDVLIAPYLGEYLGYLLNFTSLLWVNFKKRFLTLKVNLKKSLV